MPEGQQLVIIQPQRKADHLFPASLAVPKPAQKLPFIFVQIAAGPSGLPGYGAFAPVASDIFPPSVKGIDGQPAMIGAEPASSHLDLMLEAPQPLGCNQAGLFQPLSGRLFPRVKRRAKRPH